MTNTTLKTLQQLRDHAAAVLAVIDARGLEGAQHISPKSPLAYQCRDELENASHYLSHLLFALPRVPAQPGGVAMLLAFPLDSLTPEQHQAAQAGDGLLFDAYIGLFGGESWERRQHFGTTTISAIVCRQLREGIALLDGILPAEKSKSDGNGPFGLNGFRWGTLPPRTGLASTPFRLLTALWTAKDRTATFRDLAKAVWDDCEINLRDDNRLGSARRAVNDFMKAGAFPFQVRTSPQNEVVTLTESTGQAAAPPKSTAGKKARRSPRLARQ